MSDLEDVPVRVQDTGSTLVVDVTLPPGVEASSVRDRPDGPGLLRIRLPHSQPDDTPELEHSIVVRRSGIRVSTRNPAVSETRAEGSFQSEADMVEPRLQTELPGPRAREAIEADEAVTSPWLTRAYPFVPARGRGALVEDVDGNTFLDFNAGIAVCATGHCHPDVVAAITQQASQLIHYSASDFYLPVYARLCARLAALAPFPGEARVFLTNSGTEAVEAAIKLSRSATRRHHVISFLGSFHGRSYGGISASASRAKGRSPFGPLLPGMIHAPYADLFSLADHHRPELAIENYIEAVIFRRIVEPEGVAAIIVEPVLGEGGYFAPPAEWLRRLREICDTHGILLIADEVQCGVGRTGRMWAIEHAGVEPDIVISAKGLASGMPLADDRPGERHSMDSGTHGSTFGGNPVSCAAALATLDLVQSGLMDNARRIGERMCIARPVARASACATCAASA